METQDPLNLIEDDLSDAWVVAWADYGVVELEEYLAKHLAFLDFLDSAASLDDAAAA